MKSKTDDRWFAGYCMGAAGDYRRCMQYRLILILVVAIVIFSSALFFVRALTDSTYDDRRSLTVYYTDEEGERNSIYVSDIRTGDTFRIGVVQYEYRGGEGRRVTWPALPEGSEIKIGYHPAEDINELMSNVFIFFPVCFVIAFVEVILNYRSFYRPAKSIYVMKRLRSGSELHKRCWAIPLLTVFVTLITCVLLGSLFMLYYCNNTMPERLPDTISLNVWRTLIWWR